MKKQLTYDKIQQAFNRDFNFSKITRERAAADLSFFWITHWDDALLSGSQLLYKGEFDLLRKAMRDILSDMRSAPVQADFEPKDGTPEEDAEILDGIYRTSWRSNASQESSDNASIEQVVCGLGGWRLRTCITTATKKSLKSISSKTSLAMSRHTKKSMAKKKMT